MFPIRLFAATGDAVSRIESRDGERFDVTLMLEGSGAQCVAVDPLDPDRVYAGTFDKGVWRTLDGGARWDDVTGEIPHGRVLSIAMAAARESGGRSAVYAGTEPSNLYRTEDDGQSWQAFPTLPELPSAPTWSFPPRPWTHHVRWVAPHQTDPNLLFAGIELGGVMRSTDGGDTWEDRKPSSYHDSHCVRTHRLAPGRVYEAAGGGVALSDDGGESWRTADDGMDRHYVWGLAVDPANPDLWYVSASWGANTAHRSNGDAQAHIYRKRGERAWQALDGGLPSPLPYMPYALLTLRDRPSALLAGLQHGELHLSEDAGDSWRRLDVKLPALLALDESTA